MSTLQGVKRKNFSKACFLCQKGQATCDEQQPCGRCITQGVAHMCFYSDESKKRCPTNTEPAKDPLYPNAKDNRRQNNTDEILSLILAELRDMREDQRRLHEDVRVLRTQQEKIEMHLLGRNGTHTNTPSPTNGVKHAYTNGLNHSVNGMNQQESPNARQYHPYSISHDHTHGNHPVAGCLRCATNEEIATPSPTASAKLGNLGNHMGYPQNPTYTTPTTTTTTSVSPPLSHADPNWSALTTTGGNGLGGRGGGTTVNALADLMEQLKSTGGTRQFGLPNGNERDMGGKVVPMQKNLDSDTAKLTLVFDVTAQPPTVISAPENFCRMMGYDMQEVMNMPWHKFIHPSNVHRTMNILNQAHMSTTIQFPQLYKSKDGHMFRTLDTHNIVYESGRPVYDIVSISLSPSKVSIKDQRPIPKDSSTALSLRYPSIYSFSPPSSPSPNISPTISAEIHLHPAALEELPNSDAFYDSLHHPIVEDLNMSSPSPSFMNYGHPPSPAIITPATPQQASPSLNNPPMTPHHANYTIDESPPPPSPPLSSSQDFGNITMDDEELYRILTNDVQV